MTRIGGSAALVALALVLLGGASGADTVTQAYRYDDLGRLVQVEQDGTALTYRYDANSNLVARTVPEPRWLLLQLSALASVALLRLVRGQRGHGGRLSPSPGARRAKTRPRWWQSCRIMSGRRIISFLWLSLR